MKYIIRLFSLVFRVFQYCRRRESFLSAIEQGLIVGANTKIVGDVSFGSEPYLITLGDDCLITNGVSFITHDGGVQVPFIKQGCSMSEIYGRKVLAAKICVGNNVFIGNGSIVLLGTVIGDNVLVGAGSVLRGNYPSDCVLAGVPAKVVCSIEDYYRKNSPRVIGVEASEFCARKKILLESFRGDFCER